jgi:DNA repair protein RecN (Recombination protein N)
MLHTLRIQNFALIDYVELEFENGFSVLTGETGSGKSILLHALHLLLGERADLSVIGPSAAKAVVEAEFELSSDFHAFFEAQNLDFEPRSIVRRDIAKEGKSRAFINDVPVSLSILKAFTSRLVHIHSQYNTLELKSKSYQLELLDILTELLPERQAFETAYLSFNALQKELEALEKKQHEAQLAEDYDRFVFAELHELDLLNTDYQQVENEINRFENAERITESFANLAQLTDEGGVYEQLYRIKANLDKHSFSDAQLTEINQRLTSVLLEVKEVAQEAHEAMESFSVPESEKERLYAQWNAFNKALQKQKVPNAELLRERYEALHQKLETDGRMSQLVETLQHELKRKEAKLWEAANDLHAQRALRIPAIADLLQARLKELKLPHTTLVFDLQSESVLHRYGATQLNLLFSANFGIAPVPIEKAASGGELSRLMLALQQLISEKQALPTIFFDEIDTGVSGEVALRMGQLLQQMGKSTQLMAISHLPQVAAKAAHHFVVSKAIVNERMQTAVQALTSEQRVVEIARLMSGEAISAAALENAQLLLQHT